MYSFGPQGKTTHKNERKEGYNTEFGLQPSHHTASAVGFDQDTNENILYDSYFRKYMTESELIKKLKKS